MKTKLMFVLLVIFSSCDMPDFDIDTEMKLKEGTPFVYSTFLEEKIIKKTGGIASEIQTSDANYYYQFDNSSDRQFIIKCFHLDCNERMDKIKWSVNGDYFTFFIDKSTRYLSGNRLVLFKVSNKTANILLDIRDKKISNYFFENDLFKFQFLNTNDTVKIKL